MPAYSTATIIGHLGQDPVTKHLPSGDQVCEFSVATSYKRKSGEITTWWRCTAFGKTAEVVSQYLAKGDAAMVVGTPYNEAWETKEGEKRMTLRLAVDRVVLLGRREEAEPTQPQPAPTAKRAASSGGGAFDDMEDDLPWK